MFRSSNPNDAHLTNMEYQEWEKERDAKKDDFPFIQLTAQELKFLNSLSRKRIEITEKNKNIVFRLRDLVLIETLRTDLPDNRTINFCQIRERGQNYLMYVKHTKALKRIESRRYWITTVIAVTALIKAFLPEICAGLEGLLMLLVPQ